MAQTGGHDEGQFTLVCFKTLIGPSATFSQGEKDALSVIVVGAKRWRETLARKVGAKSCRREKLAPSGIEL